VTFRQARAEALSEAGVDGPFDAVFAAYLVRNVAEPDALLSSVLGLLRPGAPLVVHEYSVRDSALARAIWTAVCWTVIIPAGTVSTGDHRLFTYLWRSVTRFDGAGRFRERLRDAGFADVASSSFGGWQRGVVHTFVGRRAESR
jgi:ubiquinone/menaquinone biosynthesis C-methylase UbiE